MALAASQSRTEGLHPAVHRYLACGADSNLAVYAAYVMPRLSFDEARAKYAELLTELQERHPALIYPNLAVLGILDRYFLLTVLLGRRDALHPWVYARCREVEAEPDEYLDLWAREHFKSTIITIAGAVQEIVRDPETRIGIFSHTTPDAKKALRVIMREFEGNEMLKNAYPDVLWADPKKQSPKWSEDGGICVRRKGNPKEQTLEAHGIIDGMPTGSHFDLRIYDDIITEKAVTSPEMVDKVSTLRQLSDSLGTMGGREWNVGTRYHFADPYADMLDRDILKARVYPATDDGRLDGNPVLLTQAQWADKKRKQPRTVAAQYLQNPTAGEMTMFEPKWLRSWEVRPRTLNVYIVADPAMRPNPSHRTDRTAMAVMGLDANANWYLLDGYRHRMDLAERWKHLRGLYRKWSGMPGVQFVSVGYERYGLQSDIEHFNEMMRIEKSHFPINEVNWPRQGGASKADRVGRLVPDFKEGRLFLPAAVWHETHDPATWQVAEDGHSVVHSELKGETRDQREYRRRSLTDCIAQPIKRFDESKRVYDVTRALIEEFMLFPFGMHDDLLDAVSRIHDLSPNPPVIHDERVFEVEAFVDS